jgi:23S rRNA (guanosine2251-2'-O)-methyltransferase
LPPRRPTDGRRNAPRPERLVLTDAHPIREALRARRRRLDRLTVAPGPDGESLARLAGAAGVSVEVSAPGGRRGELPALEVGPLPDPGLEELVAGLGAGSPLLVALDGVEDPQNLGAIARVAEAAGAAGLLLTHRHAPPLSPAVSRASAGAIEWLPAARTPNLRRALKFLKEQDFWVFGADPEGTWDVFGLSDRQREGRRVVVLGAEGRGLRRGVAEEVDYRVRIPMVGRVASLNVATAAAVLLFELTRPGGGSGESQLRRECPD